ncbi:hypothetical protein PanWU01x14_149250 [Parasponia andersonii]|uniref:Uncharacterized protein n=1 Tax=Parasponia andersonii TaxID=3476 RepID=A0A2P5CIT1_PARAD|nr:hypothetical protein PanWU01x14_149250 [Parasponia andersonii]
MALKIQLKGKMASDGLSEKRDTEKFGEVTRTKEVVIVDIRNRTGMYVKGSCRLLVSTMFRSLGLILEKFSTLSQAPRIMINEFFEWDPAAEVVSITICQVQAASG